MQVIRLVKVAYWRQIQPFATNSFLFISLKKQLAYRVNIKTYRLYDVNVVQNCRWTNELIIIAWMTPAMLSTGYMPDESGSAGFPVPLFSFSPVPKYSFREELWLSVWSKGADLHMAQPMPLPLTVSCFSKIQIGFTFLVPAHPGSPGKRAVKRVCVCVCVWRSEPNDRCR